MKKAFTLIEMLVVIAIITILAALLVPAITRARKEAYKVKCTNNQHQVAQYFQMYRNDNRLSEPIPGLRYDYGGLPSWGVNLGQLDGDRNGRDDWGYDSSLSLARLYPAYVDTYEVFLCPAMEHNAEFTLREAPPGVAAVNFDLNANTVEYRFETEITEANDSDYLVDPHIPVNSRSNRAVYGDGPDLDHERAVWRMASTKLFPLRDRANHEYGAVILFYDGHSQFLRFSDVYGRLANPNLYDTVLATPIDADIYADNDHNDGRTNFDDDEQEDCDLGNYVDFQVPGGDYDGDGLIDGDPYWGGPGDPVWAPVPGFLPSSDFDPKDY